jgi:hypothetical protein
MMDSHIFICFSSKDLATALEVVAFLEGRGIPCWISARDVLPSQNYQETIVHALERAGGIVFLFSEFSSKSAEIRKELSIGGSINAPVFPLRLSSITPTGALRYELATRQWIDIFPDKEKALGKLAETIQLVLRGADVVEGDFGGARPMAGASVESAPAQVARPPAARTTRGPIVAADSKEFEAIRALLVRHVGPIAKVLVQKAATEADSPEDFCQRLAAHVKAPADRAAFLQAAQARLAARS